MKWKRSFVNVIEKDGKYYACFYRANENKPTWVNCDTLEVISDAQRVDFNHLKPTQYLESGEAVISEDDFFNTTTTDEDLKMLDSDQRKAISSPIEKNSLITSTFRCDNSSSLRLCNLKVDVLSFDPTLIASDISTQKK